MDVNNVSMGRREPFRKIDFENNENSYDFYEAEVVDTNDENKSGDHSDTHVSESKDEIHGRVSKELIPEMGMEFETENDAYEFYLSYAKAVLEYGNLIKTKKQVVFWIEFFVALEREQELQISNRKMKNSQKAVVDLVLSCGISQRDTMEHLAKQVGGPEQLGFLRDDCKNYLRSKRMNKMMSGDTGGVFEYLQRRQGEDPYFFSAIQVDEDDLITNIFWADAKMKLYYSYFGDVVCFDTTYRKHKDGRPIALFVGINNHKQTIVFGVALLYDETTSTFSWLFDTFAITMSGKKPQTMLTDQDKAMAKALASQWPETYHRLCVWHINQNAATHLSNIFAQHDNFARDFSSCMYDHDYEEDFMDAWSKMIENYDLQDNVWLKELFKIRKKWALVYGRETFCGGMTTTQRSESMNSVIKNYISYKNKLDEFFHYFERLLKDRRSKESREDFYTDQSEPIISVHVQILKHATQVYTHEIFALFQEEAGRGFDCKIDILVENSTLTEFKVTPPDKHHHHRVVHDSVDDSVSCRCNKFVFVGYLCSHALKVLNYSQVLRIPAQYIKK